ncbi:MAG: hypothetical protein OXC81_04695 [Betaproteobacteria bacterium]|nr:hypothetical protein [Betaproteobacteria bacterium]
MQTSDHYRKLIDSLDFGEAVAVDENSHQVKFRDLTLLTRNDAERGTLRLSVRLGSPHEQLGYGLIPLLLEANDEPATFMVGNLAIDADTNEVLLVREDRLVALDNATITEFCVLAQMWSEVVADYNENARRKLAAAS